jgi:hypothetical protein
MMHPRSRLLQAFVDRELTSTEEIRVREHVAGCDRCSSRVARMRTSLAVLHGAMLDVDRMEPGAWTSDVWQAPDVAIAPAGRSTGTRVLDITPRVVTPPAERGKPHRREGYRFPLRWAALFVFGTAAIGAAALIVRLNEAARVEPTSAPAQPAPAASAPLAVQGGGDIVVQPAGGAVTVRVMEPGAGSFLYVELGDRTRVTVQVTGDLTPRFRARDGAVDVTLDDVRADVRVQLPATIRDAVIQVGDRVLVRVQNGQVEPADAVNGIRLRE